MEKNEINIPMTYDDKLVVYNVKITDRKNLDKLLEEIKINNLEKPINIVKQMPFADYAVLAKHLALNYEIIQHNEKVSKDGDFVRLNATVSRRPVVYKLLKELFVSGNNKSLTSLANYLDDLKYGFNLTLFSIKENELKNSESIMQSIFEISKFVSVTSCKICEIDANTNYMVDEEYTEMARIGVDNMRCVDEDVFKFLKRPDKIKKFMM